MGAASRARAGTVAAGLLLVLGVLLRVLQAPWHTNVWTVDWLSYYEPQAQALQAHRIDGWLAAWQGLHPPLSGVIHSVLQVLGADLRVHWGFTTAATLLAVVLLADLVRRAGGGGAALLLLAWGCLSPLQVNYALNTTPYPWLLLFLAASTWRFEAALDRLDGVVLVQAGVLTALAVQTHLLAVPVAMAQALVLGWRWRARRTPGLGFLVWLATVGGTTVWTLGQGLELLHDPWTFHIGDAPTSWYGEAIRALVGRFGGSSAKLPLLALVPAGIALGLWRGPRRAVALLTVQALAMGVALGVLLAVHVADPRLTHYYAAPQLLLFAAGALGFGGALRAGWGSTPLGLNLALPASQWGYVIVGAWAVTLLATGGWGLDTLAWQAGRAATARAAVAAAPEEVLDRFEAAGPGDVVLYSWDATFLNDEPEHLDPVLAGLAASRLGRVCGWDGDAPALCNRSDGALLLFSPNLLVEDFEAHEETLRQAVNRAVAPGSATFFFVPLDAAAAEAERPWRLEAWLRAQGGVLDELMPGAILRVTFPPGARIGPPASPTGSAE